MSIVPHLDDGQNAELKILKLMAHAAMGRRLLPTAWIAADGRCSCMERESPGDTRICSRSKPGKHPRISRWQVQATCDEDKILEWHQWVPLANWGWLQDHTFALDVDPKRGGLESLAQWEEEQGGPAATLVQATPSGGWHYVYRQPVAEVDGGEGLIRVSGDILPGIEVRGYGSYIMVDPSRGVEGSWRLRDPDVVPAEPDELTLQLIARHGIDPTGWGDGVESKSGKSKSGKGKTKSSGLSSDLPATEWFLKNGFGGHTGSRNVDAYRLAWRLLALGDRYPEMYGVGTIADIFRRCWQATEQGDAPFTWDECLGALQSAWKRRERQKSEEHAAQLAMAQRLIAGSV